ncbi:amidohydrolase [Rosenbergiella epipactidis]|uniref:amidohydrolase n=1 Tax=Rosenbergiella epipactidis TaxID=1544694 RepID=UPI001F4DF941|nr:amidohydrolase [Rosenbergiella epipactidis]
MSLNTEEFSTYLTDFRHELHRFPELSSQEVETTRRIRQQLDAHQIRVLDLPLNTGLVAEVGPVDGPLFVIRSDIDALPIEEQADVSYRSEHPGIMHACGHDFHSTAALGAAIILKRQEAQLLGRVRILFQAAEEIGVGAQEIIASGALDEAFAVVGLHNDPSLPAGTIGCKGGPLTAAVDCFAISVQGVGSHAAKPEQSIDPIVIASQLVASLQSIISRNIPSADNAVVSITQFHSGSAWNIIPDKAWLEGTVRSFSAQAREKIQQRFQQIIAGFSAAFDVKIDLDWQAGPPSVVNDPHWAAFALAQATKSGLIAKEVDASPIGEDFAYYLQRTPGTFVMVGTGEQHPLHHPAFKINDQVLLPTAHYLADFAIAGLTAYRAE